MALEREKMTQEVTQALDSALERLHKIWREIGIVEEQRKDRMNVVILHLHNLLDEMVNEEERLKEKLVANVESLSDDLRQLCKDLAHKPVELQDDMSMIQKERELRLRVEKLTSEKNDRLKKLRKLRTEDQHLCDVLQHEPYYIRSNSVPTKDQLRELAEHIAELNKEKTQRYQIFKSTKENIVKFMNDLEKSAETSFEREVVIDEEDSFQLSHNQLKAMKVLHDELEEQTQKNFALAKTYRERINQLWDRLETPEDHRATFSARSTGYKPTVLKLLKDEISRLECIMLENMQKVIEAARIELVDWWNKCYISEPQRKKFRPFYTNDFSEEALKAHDEEVQRVKQYYKENQEMLELVSKRQKLWEDFLEFERKASDPNRLFNRGCNLLKEEKARKKLMKELPKVEQEVKEHIDAWELANDREFLVEGSRFVDYINKQWVEYSDAKENEKVQRQHQKNKETEQEMLYGSKPNQQKRRMGVNTTPSKTPNKVRKMNDTQKTPASMSRIQRTTVMHSPMGLPPRSKTPGMKSIAGMPPPSQPNPRSTTISSSTHQQTPVSSRRALAERNARNNTDDTHMFSHTTVSGSGTDGSVSSVHSSKASLASLQSYNDFAKGLNTRDKNNCRSSVVPRPTMY